MVEAAKFTFDTFFDDEGDDADEATGQRKNRWTEAEVEQVRAAAYAEGVATGTTSIEAQAADQFANAGQQIAAAAQTLLSEVQTHHNLLTAEAATLALNVARKLAPALIAAQPTAEIEAVIGECLTHLNREPHLVIRVSDTLIDRLKEKIDTIAFEHGLGEKVILIGAPDISPGDCLVQWADGGIARDTAALDAEISKTIERYVASIGGLPADAPPSPDVEPGKTDPDPSETSITQSDAQDTRRTED